MRLSIGGRSVFNVRLQMEVAKKNVDTVYNAKSTQNLIYSVKYNNQPYFVLVAFRPKQSLLWHRV